MTDRDDDGDPLLVRPYLLGEAGSTAPHASTQTWPEAVAEPAVAPEAADATVRIRLPAPPPRRRLPRRPLVLLIAAALTLALVGAAALVASLLPERRTPSALPIDGALPSRVVPTPAPATTAAPTGAAPTTIAATTRPQAAGSRPTTSAPTTRPTTAGPRAAPATTTTASPAVDQLVPPAADRVGRIHGNGDLCLDLNGALAVDGAQIQVYTCNDTAAQRWTLAADGTLRIVGKCATAADDGTVRLAGCDGRRAEQWRAGPDDSLVNLATAGCLTDPSAGTQSGAAVRVEECTAAERQRWKLP
jgi:hypothetical protein